ncbi:hypothetical protein [Paludisphaera soli]|uniref:hypothetical protein n=1 Tax=Paludisphaera soli TaxID=2712865 RepID=UPI0013EC001A|nr:hypothetical protein [Paludisphaera soli]
MRGLLPDADRASRSRRPILATRRPPICASLGNLRNPVAAAFRTIAEACVGLDAQLVISTGRGVAPEALGDLPGRPVAAPSWSCSAAPPWRSRTPA